MTLPEFLEGSYKRYKKDTSTFLQWLKTSGEKCGYKVGNSVQQPNQVTPKAQRLKGRARKLAKEAAAAGSGSSKSISAPISKSGRISIPPKHIIPLAEAIAHCESPFITVPAVILQAGFHAISQRKQFSDHFSQKLESNAEKTHSNKTHSYFISLLEEAMKTLNPRFPGSARTSFPPSSLGDTFAHLETRFASHAFAADHSANNLNSEETIPSTTSVEGDTDLTYELEAPVDQADRDEDRVFAIFCLIDDLQKLRKAIQKAWTSYQLGTSDLVTASTITNTAFQLAIRTQEELLTDYPSSTDYQIVLTALMSRVQQISGQNLDPDEIEIHDSIAEWIFAPVYRILNGFCDVLMPDAIPVMKRGHFGVYDPNADRTISVTENRIQDVIILTEILPELAFLHQCKITLLAEDELTKGLQKMCQTKEIPIWLTFATTAFLDIYHLLKGQVSHPSTELFKMGKLAIGTLERYFRFSQNLPDPSTWPKSNQKLLHDIHDAVQDTIINDQIWPYKEKNYRQLNTIADLSEKFYLYRGHPTLCGVIAYRMQLEMQNAGVNLCNGWGTVMYPAHLYAALRQPGNNSVSPWPLLDSIIELHGEDRIFVSERPKDIFDSYKQITLVLGYSAENFVKNRCRTTPVVSKNGPRGLSHTSVISEIFRYGLSDDGSMALTMHNIEALFNEQASTDDIILTKSKDAKHLQELRQEWAKSNRLSSLELLEALGASLPLEVKRLEVNYFHLHEQSITLLRNLNNALRAEFEKYVGNNYIENESQLPFIVVYIIMISAGSLKSAKRLGMDFAESGVLLKAGEVFEKFLKRMSMKKL